MHADAWPLAQDIKARPQDFNGLRSFSVSYNPDITEAGAMTLLAVLPAGITDVGLLGCALTEACAAD